jgi:transposase-like protein
MTATVMGVEALPALPVAEVEVSAKATRRRFSGKEKARILDEVDACTKPGEVGALLRRLGVYSSSIHRWRWARKQREAEALAPKKRGPTARATKALEVENEGLKRALSKAEARAKRAEAIIDVQKKVSEILGIQLPNTDEVT